MTTTDLPPGDVTTDAAPDLATLEEIQERVLWLATPGGGVRRNT